MTPGACSASQALPASRALPVPSTIRSASRTAAVAWIGRTELDPPPPHEPSMFWRLRSQEAAALMSAAAAGRESKAQRVRITKLRHNIRILEDDGIQSPMSAFLILALPSPSVPWREEPGPALRNSSDRSADIGALDNCYHSFLLMLLQPTSAACKIRNMHSFLKTLSPLNGWKPRCHFRGISSGPSPGIGLSAIAMVLGHCPHRHNWTPFPHPVLL